MANIQYPEEKVELGLHTLALCGGRPGRAAKILEAEGERIPRETLTYWRDKAHARRYLEIKTELAPKNREIQAARAEDIVSRATDADELLVDRVMAHAGEVEIEDSKDVVNMARAAASVAQVADIHQRNANLLREKPTQISRIENPAELIRELESLGVAKRSSSITVEVEDDGQEAT